VARLAARGLGYTAARRYTQDRGASRFVRSVGRFRPASGSSPPV